MSRRSSHPEARSSMIVAPPFPSHGFRVSADVSVKATAGRERMEPVESITMAKRGRNLHWMDFPGKPIGRPWFLHVLYDILPPVPPKIYADLCEDQGVSCRFPLPILSIKGWNISCKDFEYTSLHLGIKKAIKTP